jgi:hypothetical protein
LTGQWRDISAADLEKWNLLTRANPDDAMGDGRRGGLPARAGFPNTKAPFEDQRLKRKDGSSFWDAPASSRGRATEAQENASTFDSFFGKSLQSYAEMDRPNAPAPPASAEEGIPGLIGEMRSMMQKFDAFACRIGVAGGSK